MKYVFILGLAVCCLIACSEASEAPALRFQHYSVCADGHAAGGHAKRVAADMAAAVGGSLSLDSLGFSLEGSQAVCDNRVHHAAWQYSPPEIPAPWSIRILHTASGRVLANWRAATLQFGKAPLCAPRPPF